MKIKYNNATIHIRGVVNKIKIEDATITFIVKAQRSKKDGNNNTSGDIKEK